MGLWWVWSQDLSLWLHEREHQGQTPSPELAGCTETEAQSWDQSMPREKLLLRQRDKEAAGEEGRRRKSHSSSPPLLHSFDWDKNQGSWPCNSCPVPVLMACPRARPAAPTAPETHSATEADQDLREEQT